MVTQLFSSSNPETLFDLISTSPRHKRHFIYNRGHAPLPREPMMKEIFDWMDSYQGPVDCGGIAGVGVSVARK